MDEQSTETPARVAITYCTQCSWMLRAAWLAQELLTTFGTRLTEVALVPGTGGIFQIHVGDELVWDRKEKKGFPEVPVLKRIVRDRVAPGLTLGHTDRAGGAS